MTMTTRTYTIRLTDAEVDAVGWATIWSSSVTVVGNVMTIPVNFLGSARRALRLEGYTGPIKRGRILALSRVRRKLEKMVAECGEPVEATRVEP